MELFSDTFTFLAGVPAIAGLLVTAAAIFLTSDWRLSLTALLVQYVLVGLTLTRFVQAELAIVKILVGVLAVSILYLSGRRFKDASASQENGADGRQFLGIQVGWQAGPLGLGLRILTVIMVALAAILFFDEYRSLLPVLDGEQPAVPPDIAFVSLWLAAMGVIGLVLSGDPLRVAPAVLTILTAFDLVYAGLEPNLAAVGLMAAVTLMAALAFGYLVTVQGLREQATQEQSGAQAMPATVPAATGREEGGAG
ncbi:MAG: hypothetical protein ACK2UA_02380 [Anaerolineae bacterium]|jgi:hypothetical protein